MQTGYCTNVHAGADLDQVVANLRRFAVPVRQRFCPDEPLGIGLWLSASAARTVLADRRLPELRDWLAENGLLPFTLNGFPYGDFHRDVVKHQVYLPAWHEPARSEYTKNLIAILHGLLPAGLDGSISTLPIAWGQPAAPRQQLAQAAAELAHVAEHLARLEAETGRLIHVNLEPEPGCVLQYSTDAVRFYEDHLLPGRDERLLRRHIGICHDICHAAVMFEEQADVLGRYEAAGIAVGKIQVSSAVALDLTKADADERTAGLRQLAEFDERRYLHQTVMATEEGPVFFEDLHLALASPLAQRASSLRVHFHVPIFIDRFGHLRGTQQAIRACLAHARRHGTTSHLEAETYAWGVLPADLRQPDLAAGIAEEMAWLRNEV